MDNQKDWEEVEKWNKEREERIKENWKEIEQEQFQREEEMKEKYGIDLTKVQVDPKIDKITKTMDKAGKVIGVTIKIAYVLIIIMAYLVLFFIS